MGMPLPSTMLAGTGVFRAFVFLAEFRVATCRIFKSPNTLNGDFVMLLNLFL